MLDVETKQLLADLRGNNNERKRSAVIKLGMIGGDIAVRALIDMLGNDHQDIISRGKAAFMLGQLRDLRAVQPLINALRAAPGTIPATAAEALGKIGSRQAIGDLLIAQTRANSPNDKLMVAIREALKRLGHNESAAVPVYIYEK